MCRESASFHVKRHHACPACRGYRARSPAPILSSTHGAVPVADFRPPPARPPRKPAAKAPRNPDTSLLQKSLDTPPRNPAADASRKPRHAPPTQPRHETPPRKPRETPPPRPHATPSPTPYANPPRKPATKARHGSPPPTPQETPPPTPYTTPRRRPTAEAQHPALVSRSGTESGTKVATDRASTGGRHCRPVNGWRESRIRPLPAITAGRFT